MRRTRHVATIREIRTAYKTSVMKPEEKRGIRTRRRLEDNIKMHNHEVR
jgi:hypothetical protein